MSFFDAIFQGILQGLTEFLPVSSSGHLALYNYFFLGGQEASDPVLFTCLLHLGTLFAVVFIYHKTIGKLVIEFFRLIKDIFTGRFKWKEMAPMRRMLIMLIIAMLPLLAMVPFSNVVESAGKNIFVMSLCFLYTGVILMFAHVVGKRNLQRNKMTVKDALTIGVFQGIAVLPGISRSGSTISAGLFRGLKKENVTQFSFILSIPTILAANGLELFKARNDFGSIELIPVVIGVLVAAIAGFFAIKLINFLIKKDKFNIFAIYCLTLGGILLLEGIYETIAGQTIIQAITG